MVNVERYTVILTLCLAFLGWGTTIVTRQVTDRNYHAPAPLTAQQSQAKAYQDCVYQASTKSADCLAIIRGAK